MAESVYDEIGGGYALRRQPDPRIAALIVSALGDARTVVNVGAGTGSYEPKDRVVQSVEPSATMMAQRPVDAAPCLLGSAESLPFEDNSFDAAMAVLTIHHWSDWRAGLREMRRVARHRVVLVTFDAEASDFWLTRDYFPELLTLDRQIMPTMADLEDLLGEFQATPLPVPHDCLDGFFGAYWRRPEIYLDPVARASMSPFTTIDPIESLSRLASDLEDGSWHKRHADLLSLDAFDLGYRLLLWEKS